MRRARAWALALAGGCLAVAAAVAGALLWRGLAAPAGPALPDAPVAALADPALRASGAYLARVGNCAACHTAAGGAPMAGGRPVATPFGTVYSSNLTPDPATGLGRWTADEFARALRHGQSRDGRLLSPAFPYTAFTRLADADVLALWAYLGGLPAVQQAQPEAHMRWPFDRPWALALWRGLYFQPGRYQPDPARSAAWNRGAYLGTGLAHCGACHDQRNALQGPQTGGALRGQAVPGTAWRAPSLHRADEAGVQDWPEAEVMQWLQTGQAPHGRANGPMAEVVVAGTQHLNEADLRALTTWLRSLAQDPGPAQPTAPPATGPQQQAGQALYQRHCADCHGEQGEGAPGISPALAGNRLVTMDPPGNLVRLVLEGGFEAATLAHPRPFGMPPYGPLLSDTELADLLSYLRSAWGHQAGAIGPVEVNRLRDADGG